MYLTLQNPKTRILNALKVGWSAILFIALWLGISLSVWAQPAYDLTAVSGTFTPITGGTDVNGIEVDTGLSGVLPIGFTFTYDGVPYTDFKASSNGFLTFGVATTASGTTNDLDDDSFSTNSMYPVLAPLWDDLDGGDAVGAKAAYVLTGTAPNRVLTMEWLNWQWTYSSSTPVISFQVKLYEATGVIEYIYRQDAGAVAGFFPGASIGLTSVHTGTTVDFISLEDVSAAPTTSSTFETTTLITKPATGQIYRWTPKLFTTNPTDNATLVAPDANLVVTFASGTPTIGTGNIEIKKTSDNSVVETITLPSAQVTVTGRVVTVNPSILLDCNTEYYVNIPASAVTGVTGFTGITNMTDWSFTTTNACYTLAPADNATDVALDASPTMTFLFGTVAIGTGTIELRKTTGGTLVESFVLPSAQVTVTGNVVTVDPTNILDCNTEYYLTVPATAVSGAGFTGITSTTAWSFTTTTPTLGGYTHTSIPVNFEAIATTGTVVTAFSGGDGISSSAITMPMAFSYFGASYTQLKIGVDGWITLDASQTGGDFSNSTIPNVDGPPLMIAPFWDDLDAHSTGTVAYKDMGTYFLVSFEEVERWLENSTNSFQIKLFYATGIIEFHYGTFNTTALDRATVGIENATETSGLLINYNGTGDALGSDIAFRITPPVAVLPLTATFTPTNGATGVAPNSNLVLNFNYPVSAGTGNIEIVNTTTNAVLETIPVGDARVDYSTVGQVTINPATDFPYGVIAVRFPTGAFKSCNNIDVTGITNTTDWRFTVSDPCAAIVIDAGPNQSGITSGSNVTLAGVAATGGSGTYTYAWTPVVGLNDPTILAPTATITSNVTYTLTVTDVTANCTKSDNVSISVAAPTGGGGGGGGGGSTSPVTAPFLRLTSTGSTTMTLDWVGGSNAEGYTIFRKNNTADNFTRVSSVTASVTTFSDSLLVPNTRYSYYIQAVRGSSIANSNTVFDYTYPSIPTVASFENACVGTGAQFTVRGSSGVYNVYSDETGGTAITTGDSTGVITTPTFADATTFYISAVGSRYESTPRVAVSVITRPLPTSTMLGADLQESCTDSLTIMAEAVDGATYTWYSLNSPIATTSTPMYTVDRSGVYSVLVNRDGCVARSNTVRVRVNRVTPAEIRGLANREFCEVGILEAVETEGATYEWLLNNAVVGTGSSLEVSQSGTYTVSVTSALGCTLTSSSVTVSVISVPQLDLQTSAPDFCEGTEGVELSVNAVNGASYEWLRNGRRIRTTSTPSLQVNVGAEYRVRVVLNGTCSRTSDAVMVTRNAAPAASVRVYGDSIKVVYVGNVDIASVTWTKDDAPFSATTQAFAPTESGIYTATVTYSTGCQVVSSGIQYIKPPVVVIVGEEEVEALGFMLFPNPTTSKVNLNFGDAFKGDITLTLTDAIGRTIQVTKVKASENATIDLSKVANGNYMLTIASDDKVVTRKIIRE
ncbi:fibronectin type III domain-containing protein [Bernardetia litoralis DSM 6794]|uniref:Fibronectin type III domain-containing protein n=2 Tax=Bernardetia litoralis TaxID=999 RepID=I4AKS0_BERLS|nr:fibronectin type III domain-containing protein [Bernardetia litoralis DSM 6794]